eukprot:scaffold9965_cov64-Phaeocystis_antarctica.AAC.4
MMTFDATLATTPTQIVFDSSPPSCSSGPCVSSRLVLHAISVAPKSVSKRCSICARTDRAALPRTNERPLCFGGGVINTTGRVRRRLKHDGTRALRWRQPLGATRDTDRQTDRQFGRKTYSKQLGCCATHLRRHNSAPWCGGARGAAV